MERIIHLRERDIHHLPVVQYDIFMRIIWENINLRIKSHGAGTFSSQEGALQETEHTTYSLCKREM